MHINFDALKFSIIYKIPALTTITTMVMSPLMTSSSLGTYVVRTYCIPHDYDDVIIERPVDVLRSKQVEEVTVVMKEINPYTGGLINQGPRKISVELHHRAIVFSRG